MKGKALADTILSHLKSLNLLLEKMIGQGYNGASSMSGKEVGVRAIVKESCSLAAYGHHLAHILVKFCALPKTHSTFYFIGNITSFLNQAVKKMLN